jgi:hypothetical protein
MLGREDLGFGCRYKRLHPGEGKTRRAERKRCTEKKEGTKDEKRIRNKE